MADGTIVTGTMIATSTPTADTISKFDSSAKMNSTDMSSADVSSFVAGLNTGVSDYVQRSEVIFDEPFHIETVSKTVTINATSGATFSMTIPTVSGYTPVAIARFEQNHGNSVFVTSQASLSSLYLYNSYSSSQSTTLTVDYLYIKDTLLNWA